MHLKSSILPLLATVTLASATEIDLTPIVSDYVANGAKIHQLTFKDGDRRIQYEPPGDWTLEPGAAQLTLKAKQIFAQAVISVTPLLKPQPLDDSIIKSLTEKVLAELPVGSQFAKVDEQTANPVLVGGHESVEVTVSYQLAGEKFVRSVLVSNLPDAQLQFRLSAKKSDFAALHREFKVSLLTWQWTEAKQDSADSTQSGPAAGQ